MSNIKVKLFKKTRLNEDNAPIAQNDNTQNTNQNQQIQQPQQSQQSQQTNILNGLYAQATQLQQNIANVKKQIDNYNNQLIQLNKKIAAAGGQPITLEQ
jgi:predicted RNase H-like nuclease (RuvC/YqgF family)